MTNLSRKISLMAAGLTILAATPVIAQGYDNEFTVTGQSRHVPDSVMRLSQRVAYDDLDLSRAYDRQVLRNRIGDSANFLCDRLGESDDNLGVVPSCQTAAYQGGVQQARWVEGRYRGYSYRGY